MTRAEYMIRLTDKLSSMPEVRRREIVEEILAHFNDGGSEGISDEALAEGLGSPELLAKEYRAAYASEQASIKPSIGNVMRVVWAGMGMGMLNLIFVLPIVAIVFAVWLSLVVMGGAMALAGALAAILAIISIIIPIAFVYIAYPVISIFACVMIASLGGLILIGSLRLGGAMGKFIARYVRTNIEIISGKRKQNAQES